MPNIDGNRIRLWQLAFMASLLGCHATPSNANDAGAPLTSPPPLVQNPAAAGEPTPSLEATTTNERDASAAGEALTERLSIAGLEVAETRDFLDVLKGLVAKGDRPGVCSLVSYPLAPHSRGANEKIPNQASCLRVFDQLFTAQVMDTIGKQHLETLVANSQGVMIGDGAVWFSGICSDRQCRRKTIKIITVNN